MGMKLNVLRAALVCFCMSGLGVAFAEENSAGALVFISYKANEGEDVELQLNFEGAIPEPDSFTTKNPARITFDFPNVKNALPWTLPLPIKGSDNAKSVTTVEAGGRTRVVINLEELVEHTMRVEGSSLFVGLSDKVASKSTASVTAESTDQGVPEMQRALDVSSGTAVSASSTELQLMDAKFFALPGNKVQVRLEFSGSPPKPNTFTIDNPARLILDLPGTINKLRQPSQDIGVGAAKNVAAIQASGRTRVVLGLSAMRPYEIRVEGNALLIDIEGQSRDTTKLASGKGFAVEDIDFRRGENGEGRVIVKFSGTGAMVDTRVSGGKIYVDMPDAQLSAGLSQRYDVVDFATPVQFFDAISEGRKSRLIISTSEEFEYLVYQAEDQLTIDVKHIDESVSIGAKDGEYTGEKLSLNFQDIEVRAVLQLIADFTGLNMVASDTVQGNLTLRLKNVPWDQALEIILKTKGLDMRQDGNVILIAPAEEIAAREKMELEAQQQLTELEPLRTELMQVNYAKASDIAKLLMGEEGLLSERGKVSVDERTNVLLVTDIRDRREGVQDLLVKLDIPIRQVMIDSRIVIASSDFSRDLGARFGVTSTQESGSNLIMNSGSYEATDRMMGSALDNLADSNNPYPIEVPFGGPSRLNVNMPVVASNAASFGLAILRGDTLLDLELSALQAEGRGEVVSNPRVITSNGKEALIEQGTEIPYQEASSSGATTVSFKKAVLSLKVTPQITPDDRILMDLAVNKDSVGTVYLGVPSIDTKEVNTQVLVENGDTVVLGGVYEQEKSNEVDKVPLLGDLPIVGALFRQTRAKDDKTELLIFVTPKVLSEGVKLR